MRLGKLRQHFESELSSYYPSEEIHSFFNLLTEAWLGYSRIDISLHTSEVIPDEKISDYQNAIHRLKQNEPIQYILGTTHFLELTLEVTPDTLIPRPETEELVEWIIRERPGSEKILDIGTGSGCIAIALAKGIPNSEVSAIDISEKALEVARRNATLNKVEIQFIQVDILGMDSLPEPYDVIVSNPPYVREQEKEFMHDNVLLHEPESALFVPETDPLIFYRAISQLASQYLKDGGQLFFEINEYLSKEMVSLLGEEGFQNIELRRDFRGKDRFVRCRK